MFEGRTLNLIKPFGGLVAGQPKHYKLWTQGSIITVKNPEQVKAIDEAIKEAKRMEVDVKNYLEYMIDQEGILN